MKKVSYLCFDVALGGQAPVALSPKFSEEGEGFEG